MITSPKDFKAKLFELNNPNPQIKIIHLPSDEPFYKINLQKRTIETPEFLSVREDHNAETIFFEVDRYFDNIDLSKMACIITYINANPNSKENGFIYSPPFIDIKTKPGKIIIPWVIEGPATKYAGTITFSFQFYHVSKSYKINGQILSVEQYEKLYGYGNLPEYTKVIITKEQYDENKSSYFLRNEKSECYLPRDIENVEFDVNAEYYQRKTKEQIDALNPGYYFDYNLNTIPSKSKILYGMQEIYNQSDQEDISTPNNFETIWSAINDLRIRYEDENILYWTILEDEE